MYEVNDFYEPKKSKSFDLLNYIDFLFSKDATYISNVLLYLSICS